MIAENIKKCKNKIKPYENDLILVMVIILVALISFGLGRLSKIRENKIPITIENTINGAGEVAPAAPKPGFGAEPKPGFGALYVASKNGVKYHYPWCSGALNIKEENKIWFSSKEEAEKAGYSPAGNCKGL